jgi:hypothetical protein
VRPGLRNAPRAAPGAEPASLAAELNEHIVAIAAAVQAQESMRHDAGSKEGIKLARHDLRQFGAGSVFGLIEESHG